MIIKVFYDEKDYKIVLKLLHGMVIPEEDLERVKTRQLFLEQVDGK